MARDYHLYLNDDELAERYEHYVKKYGISKSQLFKNWVKEWVKEAELMEDNEPLNVFL